MKEYDRDEDEALPPDTMAVSSIYGHRTREPLVVLNWREMSLQMTPEEGQALAANILQCCDAALSDAFLIEFLQDTLKLPLEHAGLVTKEFRKFRDARRERGDNTPATGQGDAPDLLRAVKALCHLARSMNCGPGWTQELFDEVIAFGDAAIRKAETT